MRGGVIENRGGARVGIDLGAELVADADAAGFHAADVQDGIAGLARVVDDEAHADQPQLAAVADLATALGVERRAIENHHAGLAGAQVVDRLAIPEQGDDLAVVAEMVVAGELRLALDANAGLVGDVELLCGAGALALRLHRGLEAGADRWRCPGRAPRRR